MRRLERVTHEFVEFIPQELEPRTIYISGKYATCAHLCLCGCGEKVVTPLAPREWRLTFDGESVSLDPSIGNWSFDCQSHYWVEQSRVIWARRWTKDRIDANRARDRRQKQRLHAEADDELDGDGAVTEGHSDETPGWLRRVARNLKERIRR